MKLTCNRGTKKAESATLCFKPWSSGKIKRGSKGEEVPNTWGTHRCYMPKGHTGVCECECGVRMRQPGGYEP